MYRTTLQTFTTYKQVPTVTNRLLHTNRIKYAAYVGPEYPPRSNTQLPLQDTKLVTKVLPDIELGPTTKHTVIALPRSQSQLTHNYPIVAEQTPQHKLLLSVILALITGSLLTSRLVYEFQSVDQAKPYHINAFIRINEKIVPVTVIYDYTTTANFTSMDFVKKHALPLYDYTETQVLTWQGTTVQCTQYALIEFGKQRRIIDNDTVRLVWKSYGELECAIIPSIHGDITVGRKDINRIGTSTVSYQHNLIVA